MPITVKFSADTKGLEDGGKRAEKALENVEKQGGALKSSFSGINGVLDGVGGALKSVASIASGFVIGQGLLKAPSALMGLTSTARDLELQMKKAVTVFGDDAFGDVQDWASEMAHHLGLTKAEATNLAAGLGDLLVPMGFTRDEAAQLSTKTIGLAGALAEWSGGAKSAAEVSEILTSAYLGETDGLKALGISISAADVEQRLLAKGQKDLTGTARQQAAALAIQEMIFEKSTDAQNAFATGADSAARKQAEMTAEIKEAKQELAQAMAPAIAAVTTKLAEMVPVAIEGGRVFLEKVAPHIQAFVTWLQPKLAEAGAFFQTEILPRIQAFITWLIPQLQAMGAFIGEQFSKFKQYYQSDIKPALDNIVAAVEFVIAWIREHWPEIEAIIKPVLEQVQNVVETTFKVLREVFQIFIDLLGGDFSGAWQNFKELIGIVWDYIKETIDNTIELIKGIMSAGWEAIKFTAGKAWDEFKAKIDDVWEGIKGLIGKAIAYVKDDLVRDMGSAALALGEAFSDGIVKGFKGTVGVLGDLTQRLWDAIKSIINTGIQALNDAIPNSIELKIKGVGVSIELPNNPIPMLAQGGIVKGPTTAIIGEAGPEAVVPLSGPNVLTSSLQRIEGSLQASGQRGERAAPAGGVQGSTADSELAGVLKEMGMEIAAGQDKQISLMERMTMLLGMLLDVTRSRPGISLDNLIDAIDRRRADGWAPA